jgi:hypothetical protein
MATYAIVVNGIVVNNVVCDPSDIPNDLPVDTIYVLYTVENPAVIGLGYDGSNFEQTQSTEKTPAEIRGETEN